LIARGFVEQVGVHLERLRRHSEAVQRTGDEISLLDLANTLRIWADMKKGLGEYFPAYSRIRRFRTASPPSKLATRTRNVRHVHCYLGHAVTANAAGGEIFHNPEVWQPAVAHGDFKPLSLDPQIFEISHFCMVETNLTKDEAKLFDHPRYSSVDYSEWLGSEVARVGFLINGQLQRFTLTREQFIRRVANVLGGSHPENAGPPDNDLENRFDPPVKFLLGMRVVGLPLPYFVLLNCAQEILRHGSPASSMGAQ
jgi:hypothetical protein